MSSTVRRAKELLKDAVVEWQANQALLEPKLLDHLASEGLDIANEDSELVLRSLIKEIKREIQWILDWEIGEQGSEINNFPDLSLPTFPKYERCERLLNWAATHGLNRRVADVHKSITATFPASGNAIVHWLQSYRDGLVAQNEPAQNSANAPRPI